MRRAALVACALALALVGVVRALASRQGGAEPLACTEIVTIEAADGARVGCVDDPALKDCGRVHAGLRYRGCEVVGTVPGSILVARGLAIDVSHASETDLRALPNVGASLARRIVEARDAGPLCAIADLDRIQGLGPKRLAALEGKVAFSDPRCSR